MPTCIVLLIIVHTLNNSAAGSIIVMSRRAPNSLYQATFSQRSSSTPVSPVTNNGCCGPKDDIHEPNIVELAATLNKREFEIRTLIQKNMALNKILQNQGPPRISTSTYGIVPPHSVDMRDDVYQHYMREEEYRIQSNGAGVLHSKKDNMIELLKQEKAKLKDKTKSLEKTVKTLNDEIAMYKKQLHASKALAEEQSQIHRENEHIVNDLKEKNADLWKKWKKEIYTVKGKDALLDVQRQRMEEQENLIQNYEKKFPSGVVDIPKRALLHDLIHFC